MYIDFLFLAVQNSSMGLNVETIETFDVSDKEILVQSAWIAKNKNWIAAGLQNMKTSIFCCFDCASTSMVQTMYTHSIPSFAALSCCALVLQPWTQSAYNPH